MKLVRIDHERCGSYDGYSTYVMAPDEWNDSTTSDKINAAMDNYLEALAKAKLDDPDPGYVHESEMFKTAAKENPHLRVSEVQALIEQKKQERKEWSERQKALNRGFAKFLEDQGFQSLWKATEDQGFEAIWGHRHGTRIDYSDNGDTLDPFPTPKEVLEKRRESLF